ncbi:hypothetical protein HaLaN_27631, partial [Haematococcus lacustris]
HERAPIVVYNLCKCSVNRGSGPTAGEVTVTVAPESQQPEGDHPRLLTYRSLLTHGRLAHWLAANSWVLDDTGELPDVDAPPRQAIEGPSLDEFRSMLGIGYASILPNADHDNRTPRPPRPPLRPGERPPMPPHG